MSNYKKTLSTWIDVPSEKLVEKWGYPDGTFEKKTGKKAYIYKKSRSFYMAGDNDQGTNLDFQCKTIFHLDHDGVIRGAEAEGNDCN